MSSNSDLPEAKKPIIFQKNLKEKLAQEALKKAALTEDAEALSRFVLHTMAEKPKK